MQKLIATPPGWEEIRARVYAQDPAFAKRQAYLARNEVDEAKCFRFTLAYNVIMYAALVKEAVAVHQPIDEIVRKLNDFHDAFFRYGWQVTGHRADADGIVDAFKRIYPWMAENGFLDEVELKTDIADVWEFYQKTFHVGKYAV